MNFRSTNVTAPHQTAAFSWTDFSNAALFYLTAFGSLVGASQLFLMSLCKVPGLMAITPAEFLDTAWYVWTFVGVCTFVQTMMLLEKLHLFGAATFFTAAASLSFYGAMSALLEQHGHVVPFAEVMQSAIPMAWALIVPALGYIFVYSENQAH